MELGNRQIELTLAGSTYEVLYAKYYFFRRTDRKGRPITHLKGGDIMIVMESTNDMSIFEHMVEKMAPPTKGKLEFFAGNDKRCYRRLVFDKCYVYHYEERMGLHSWTPIKTYLLITPQRLDINDNIKLDRREETVNALHWVKMEEEEKVDGQQRQEVNRVIELCSFEKFELSGSHGRSYKLVVDGQTGSECRGKYGSAFLQIVGDDTIRTNFVAVCKHNNKDICERIEVDRGITNTYASGDSFKVIPKDEREDSALLNFLRTAISLDTLTPNIYEARHTSCNNRNSHCAFIEVFPKFSWDGKVAIKLKSKEGGDKGIFGWGWELTPFDFTAEYGTTKYSCKVENAEQNEVNTGMSDGIFEFFKKIDEMRRTIFGKDDGNKKDGVIRKRLKNNKGLGIINEQPKVVFDVLYPNLEISGGAELIESNEGPEVLLNRKPLFFKLDPLIGLNMEIDLIACFASIFGPQTEFITSLVRAYSKEGIGTSKVNVKAEIKLILKAQGDIKGELGWNMVSNHKLGKATNGDPNTLIESCRDSKIGARIGFGLVGSAETEANVFKLKFRAGLEAGIKGENGEEFVGITGELKSVKTSDGKPGTQGEIKFTGIEIYWSAYTETSVVGDISDGENKNKKKNPFNKRSASKKDKKSGSQVVLEAKTLWQNNNTTAILS